MATVTWSQQLNAPQIRQILTSPHGPALLPLLARGLRVETKAKQNLAGVGGPKRIDTGRLRASIHTAVAFRNGVPAVTVGTNVFYAAWVHDGTGIYGPRQQPIRPRNH